jgi:gamma-glutamyltranspeptidase/glutathione hydrolase
MTGLGGDMFAMVYIASSGELLGLNASGCAPRDASIEFFERRRLRQIPLRGAFSVTVPGAVDGWVALLERCGTMSLADVLAPAIAYAEEGFPVSEIIAADWASAENAPLLADPVFARAYAIGGRPPAQGDVFVNKDLAATLRAIARDGRRAFYEGEVARRIAGRLQELDWPLTVEDLSRQRCEWVEPISTSYKDHQVYELPPNGQGIAALEMLNILESDDLRELGHNSAAYLHLLVEAKKLAFADLAAWLADPRSVRLPVERLLSKEYARKQRRRIRRDRAASAPKAAIRERVEFLDAVAAGAVIERRAGVERGRLERGDTVYLTVVDRERNAVSFINSLFWQFGSGVVVPGTGIVLQNRGALFSLDRKHPNRLEGGKRPYHTIIPAMVFRDGKPWMSFGVMGGDMQPQGHVQALLNRIEFGLNVQAAGEAPRFRHSAVEGLALESAIRPSVAKELARKGHRLFREPGIFGGYQAIEIDWQRGVLLGGSDPRKDGCAVGW